MKTINTKTEGDSGYIAILNGKSIALYASGLYEAKLKAIEHLKPTKRQMGLLSVTLAQRADGTDYVHTAN